MKKRILILWLLLTHSFSAFGWGFFAHKFINRHAVFTLPEEIFPFYKTYIHFITENAVNPDKRRYMVEGEDAHHYIDLDHYGDNALVEVPQQKYWQQAIMQYGEETLLEHGILPWHIMHMKHRLTKAFQEKDVVKILKLSADIGHYIADANVPLHTTQNYNGQLTQQEGIHAFWETRLPILFAASYDLLTGTATYVTDPQQAAWEAIVTSHKGVSCVLELEKELSQTFPTTQKYSFEQHGGVLKKVYSLAFSTAYHESLAGQVERQMQRSIKMVGDFWFTCWVDAGKPDLNALLKRPVAKETLQEKIVATKKRIKARTCEDEYHEH